MKHLPLVLIALGTQFAAAPGFAAACEGSEQYLFSCGTADAQGQYRDEGPAICGTQTPDGMGWETMRYVYESEKGVEFSYPPDPHDGKTKLFFHHYFAAGLYHARVRFENGGFTYQVHFDDTPPSKDPDTVNGPEAGVRVLRHGKVVADIACAERPASRFDDIRQGTACDRKNPYGEKACQPDALELP